MISQYQNEIIASIIILSIVIIYMLLKIKTNKTTQTNDVAIEENQEEETLIEDVQKVPDEEISEEILIGSEEGNFEEIQDEQEIDLEVQDMHVITKRDVPKHGKITKKNFSEFSGERILVAEDNLINQKVLTGLLAGSGIEILIASNGQEALDILEEDTDFLMILMDAHMPILDGFEATRAIRKEKKYDHILVVALSGDTATDDIQKMRNAGMQEQLEKPLRMRTLYDIFYAYTGKKEANNDYIEVIITKDLNGDKGLKICGGDEDFYLEILNEFIQTYENSAQDLGDLLREEKIDQADKLLLDILGITANIGADPLNQLAHDIKVSLNDHAQISYFTLLDQYKSHLQNLVVDIKKYQI